MKKRPIDYRDHRLVISILGVIYEADDDVDPAEIVEIFAGPTWKRDTVIRTIGDLVELGAVRRVQQTDRGSRALLRMTGLGRAWVDRRLEPYVPRVEDADPDGQGDETAGETGPPRPDPDPDR